jgi:aminobenzoyl-glutamate utilization protein B
MDAYRPAMKTLYYDPAKYTSYLEQLGIEYPTTRTTSGQTAGEPE